MSKRWLVAATCAAVLLLAVWRHYANRWPPGVTPPSDRSWVGGSITFEASKNSNERAIHLVGNWPSTVSSDLWIRYSLGLTQGESPIMLCIESTTTLQSFQRLGTGVSDYTESAAKRFDLKRPYRAVFDYEIWKGENNRGELLEKRTILSEPIVDGEFQGD